MMKTARRIFLLAGCLVSLGSPFAHHAVEAFFDQDVDVEISGTVERWIFRNPHPVLLMNASDASGVTVQWQVHFPPATVLAKRGWTSETFRPGDEVIASGHPSRQPGTHGLEYRGIRRADGSPVVAP